MREVSDPAVGTSGPLSRASGAACLLAFWKLLRAENSFRVLPQELGKESRGG